jgi:hypothetical protein
VVCGLVGRCWSWCQIKNRLCGCRDHCRARGVQCWMQNRLRDRRDCRVSRSREENRRHDGKKHRACDHCHFWLHCCRYHWCLTSRQGELLGC